MPSQDYMPLTITQDELSANAKGGTELLKQRLLKMDFDEDLVKDIQITFSRVRDLDPSKKQILYLHDLPNDPESQKLYDADYRKQFAKIVCVSYWQMQQYNTVLGVPYEEMVVIPNTIEPFDVDINKKFESINKGEPIKLIYHSTPHRGLDILYYVFDLLSKEHDNIELDVYSSFKLYGWEERDKTYEELFNLLKNHPKVNYHGTQPNEVVREALTKSHIFAFPSIWPETSCLCLIEAMAAGNICVHTDLAALPETSGFGKYTRMYHYHEDVYKHIPLFYQNLKHTISLFKPEHIPVLANAAKNAQIWVSSLNQNMSKVWWRDLFESI